MATDKISGLSSIIAKSGKWVKNSSDEQHLSMTSSNIAILRQLIKLAVFPVSLRKNGQWVKN